jgi:hypothetical protein
MTRALEAIVICCRSECSSWLTLHCSVAATSMLNVVAHRRQFSFDKGGDPHECLSFENINAQTFDRAELKKEVSQTIWTAQSKIVVLMPVCCAGCDAAGSHGLINDREGCGLGRCCQQHSQQYSRTVAKYPVTQGIKHHRYL